ncbi:hypothetical protein J437_LFUL007280 [Ladona fulva]|uniref:Uncharacterized protein n=1 Tax=Ladona fulva TaxID=123851 RepID=A0A8K0K5X0_LADFU|nr:hypothetical protein J437_LFUL007280 [Ladona fulva]
MLDFKLNNSTDAVKGVMDLFCYEVLDLFGEPAPKIQRLCDKTPECLFITSEDMELFFSLLEFDKFFVYADKYLIAMVITYFKRAGYSYQDYSVFNFFVALYLAHDMEEDEEDLKYIVSRWAFGTRWEFKQNELLNCRDKLWRLMNYRAVVSKKCCEEVMSMVPNHPIWERERSKEYGGARRELWDNWYKPSPSYTKELLLSSVQPEVSVCNTRNPFLSITSDSGEKEKCPSIGGSGDTKKEFKRDGLPTGVCVRLDNGIQITFHLQEE